MGALPESLSFHSLAGLTSMCATALAASVAINNPRLLYDHCKTVVTNRAVLDSLIVSPAHDLGPSSERFQGSN